MIHRSWPYHGGSERYVFEHALASVKRGHQAVIATTDAWDMSVFVSRRGKKLPVGRILHQGVEIIRFPVVNPPFQNLLRAFMRRIAQGGPDRFFYPNPFVPSLDRWLRSDHGFDLVHANAMPFLIHGGYRHSVKFSVPLVVVPHANIGGYRERITPLHYFKGDQKKIFREADLLVAQNNFEASVYGEECRVSPKNIMVHGSGIDPDEWKNTSSDNALKALSIPPHVPIVLSVTAHCRDKGSFTLLDSAIQLWKEGLDFFLVLAGSVMDDFRQYMDEKSGEISDGKLIVPGYITEKIRKDLFTAASVVAAPSRLDAFGIVLLDGWISGTPVIGCNAGGMPDLIHHGKDGFLVEFDDSPDLARRIRELLENNRKADSMGSAGRENTLKNHTWENVTDRFFRELETRGICTG